MTNSSIEGRWWILVEEEPINMASTSVYELRDGVVLDGRSGDALGAYGAEADSFILTLRKGRDDLVLTLRPSRSGPRPLGVVNDHMYGTIEGQFDTLNATALRDGPYIQEMHDANQADEGA